MIPRLCRRHWPHLNFCAPRQHQRGQIGDGTADCPGIGPPGARSASRTAWELKFWPLRSTCDPEHRKLRPNLRAAGVLARAAATKKRCAGRQIAPPLPLRGALGVEPQYAIAAQNYHNQVLPAARLTLFDQLLLLNAARQKHPGRRRIDKDSVVLATMRAPIKVVFKHLVRGRKFVHWSL